MSSARSSIKPSARQGHRRGESASTSRNAPYLARGGSVPSTGSVAAAEVTDFRQLSGSVAPRGTRTGGRVPAPASEHSLRDRRFSNDSDSLPSLVFGNSTSSESSWHSQRSVDYIGGAPDEHELFPGAAPRNLPRENGSFGLNSANLAFQNGRHAGVAVGAGPRDGAAGLFADLDCTWPRYHERSPESHVNYIRNELRRFDDIFFGRRN